MEGQCPDGPWCKAAAVAEALSRADGDVLVLADADVVCDGVRLAVEMVGRGAPWAIPHHKVHRLGEQATNEVYAGVPPNLTVGGLARRPYEGVEGGGLVVLRRETYERVPLDPRFANWGNEDESFGVALKTLAGRPYRGITSLWHLHHPLAERLNAHVGNATNWALRVRYQYNSGDKAAMQALLAEFRPTPQEV